MSVIMLSKNLQASLTVSENKLSSSHIPVLCGEMVKILNPKPHEIYVDCTFGLGGYTTSILDADDCSVIGIDQDPDAIKRGKALQQKFSPRLTLIEGKFSEMERLLQEHGIYKVHGIVMDIGVSSPQLDEADRGFSFQKEGKLDMRMSKKGQSAFDIINTYTEKQLADIIFKFGDEHASRRIAKRIVAERPLETTTQLANVIYKVLPKHGGQKIDPATKTFQAIRIYVNKELEELELALRAAERVLYPEGRLVVVTFHGLEDRIVKKFLRERSGLTENGSRYLPLKNAIAPSTFILEDKRSLEPSIEEILENPRARSGRLRWAIRNAQESWKETA